MKCAQHYSFFAAVLAFVSLSNASPSLKVVSSYNTDTTKRSLQFIFDNVLDSVGLGDSDGDVDFDGDFDVDFVGDFDLCNIVEAAVGMGAGFGVSANCQCDGDWDTGLTLGCNYDECTPGSGVCGKVDLRFTLGGPDGPIDMTACANFEGDLYQETCFSYGFEGTGDGGGFAPTCEATYGGQQCDCDIENSICLSVDCSRLLPGAKIDTCQVLSMVNEDDMANWFPDFEVFQPNFQLQAKTIPWENLDFDNLDFDNFDVGGVQWEDYFDNFKDDIDESTMTWVDLIGDNPSFLDAEGLSSGVCTLMFQAANLSEELGMESSCKCGYDETKEILTLSCDFSEACTSSDDVLCGSVTMELTYANLGDIYADVCIEYRQFPEVCYSYGIPFANPIPAPGSDPAAPNLATPFLGDCLARYGGDANTCKCTIDDLCLSVDCSDFEPLAITDTCQMVDLNGVTPKNPSKMVLNFRAPGEDDVVSDGAGGEFVALESTRDSGSASNGCVPMARTLTAMLATGLLVIGGQLLL